MALGSDGNPWIAFSDQAVVKLAVRENGTWRVETVAERGLRAFGQLVSLAVDANDAPHITYFQVTDTAPLDGVVMYAKGALSN